MLLTLAAFIVAAFYGCASISGLANFAKCDFGFKSVSDVSLCNINVSNKKSLKDFSVADGLALANAFMTKQFPLSLNVNVDVKNPNAKTASLSGFDYILWIDDMKMTQGKMDKQISLQANESTVMPVNFQLNLSEILSSEAKDKLMNFGLGLATSNPDASRVKLSLKPYFRVGSQVMKSPAYITIGGNKLMPSSN